MFPVKIRDFRFQYFAGSKHSHRLAADISGSDHPAADLDQIRQCEVFPAQGGNSGALSDEKIQQVLFYICLLCGSGVQIGLGLLKAYIPVIQFFCMDLEPGK